MNIFYLKMFEKLKTLSFPIMWHVTWFCSICVLSVHYSFSHLTKDGLFSESVIRFSNLQISKMKISQITILSLKFEFAVYWQVQDSDLEYFFGDLKNTLHFLKKSYLYNYVRKCGNQARRNTSKKIVYFLGDLKNSKKFPEIIWPLSLLNIEGFDLPCTKGKK